ncbi:MULTISPECIES: metallophosphoesterase [unclassified Oceanispirochaeta]|nr:MULTISPECIES: metallophosphoesterase [unclassified Oceanispirochaeta]MBF9019006.1 metallophosphoesterase [Oceanispirochaeta sp. M2]NPD75506.1 hypothetical protein [Oceanispirochaeta sp. M1]
MDQDAGELIPEFTEYQKESGIDYLEILVYGDAGTGDDGQRLTASAMSDYVQNPVNQIEFIINLGDSFYSVGVESVTDPQWYSTFESIYDPDILSMPFYSILGNHDYQGNIGAQLEYVSPNNDRWQMPSFFYKQSRTLPDGTKADFLFLDTESIFYGDAEQLVWLDSCLEESDADWKIVCGHKPLFSNGDHGSNGPLIARLQEILDHRADLYICGHEHDLQILDKVNGVYYIVNGAAARLRDTSVGDNTILAASRIGFMTLLMSESELVCKVIESGSGIINTTVLKEK